MILILILISAFVLILILTGFFVGTVKTMKQYPGSGSIPVASVVFSIMIIAIVGFGLSLTIDGTWNGKGSVISKQHSEETTKKVWSGKSYITRVTPECFGLSIAPDDQKSRTKIVDVCIAQESWNKIQVNQHVSIGGEKGVNFVE